MLSARFGLFAIIVFSLLGCSTFSAKNTSKAIDYFPESRLSKASEKSFRKIASAKVGDLAANVDGNPNSAENVQLAVDALTRVYWGTGGEEATGLATLDVLLDQGLDPNKIVPDCGHSYLNRAPARTKNVSLFHCAVGNIDRSGRLIKIVEKMIQGKADINAKNTDGDTALIVAATDSYIEVVNLLLRSPGIDTNATNKRGDTALSAAIRKGGRPQTVRALAKAGAIVLNLNSPETFQLAADALEVAYWENAERKESGIAALDALLDLGLNPNGVVPECGHAFLNRAPARIRNVSLFQCAVGNVDNFGRLIEIIEKMIKKKADINIRNLDGDTPLIIAATESYPEVVELLLKTPGVDINARNNKGNTALQEAILSNRARTVKTLEAAGAGL